MNHKERDKDRETERQRQRDGDREAETDRLWLFIGTQELPSGVKGNILNRVCVALQCPLVIASLIVPDLHQDRKHVCIQSQSLPTSFHHDNFTIPDQHMKREHSHAQGHAPTMCVLNQMSHARPGQLVGRASDLRSKGCKFVSRQVQRENFLLSS